MQKKKASPDEMWKFIEEIVKPLPLVPDRSMLNSEQLSLIYSKLKQTDKMFRDLETAYNLKKLDGGRKQSQFQLHLRFIEIIN